MGVIRQADLEHVARDAVVLHLGDLGAQGEAIKAQARREAAGIVQAARAERERLIEGARELGRAQGLKEGREEGLKVGREEGRAAGLAEARPRLEALNQGWSRALEEFLATRGGMLEQAKRDVLRLAVLGAQSITKRRLEVDPTLVVDQVRAAIAEAAAPTGLTLRLNPQDVELVRDALPGVLGTLGGDESQARLAPDASLTRGSCVVSRSSGGVDASIDTQLARIAEALLPGAPSEAGGGT
jgi:flagellar biosynthesis/type III secretory pathway protein FliH